MYVLRMLNLGQSDPLDIRVNKTCLDRYLQYDFCLLYIISRSPFSALKDVRGILKLQEMLTECRRRESESVCLERAELPTAKRCMRTRSC